MENIIIDTSFSTYSGRCHHDINIETIPDFSIVDFIQKFKRTPLRDFNISGARYTKYDEMMVLGECYQRATRLPIQDRSNSKSRRLYVLWTKTQLKFQYQIGRRIERYISLARISFWSIFLVNKMRTQYMTIVHVFMQDIHLLIEIIFLSFSLIVLIAWNLFISSYQFSSLSLSLSFRLFQSMRLLYRFELTKSCNDHDGERNDLWSKRQQKCSFDLVEIPNCWLRNRSPWHVSIQSWPEFTLPHYFRTRK